MSDYFIDLMLTGMARYFQGTGASKLLAGGRVAKHITTQQLPDSSSQQ